MPQAFEWKEFIEKWKYVTCLYWDDKAGKFRKRERITGSAVEIWRFSNEPFVEEVNDLC